MGSLVPKNKNSNCSRYVSYISFLFSFFIVVTHLIIFYIRVIFFITYDEVIGYKLNRSIKKYKLKVPLK